jgi:hypothetical protein
MHETLHFYCCLLGVLFTQDINTQKKTRATHIRTPNPGFNPGFTPRICYIKEWGDEPRVKPGVWRPEVWAQLKLT